MRILLHWDQIIRFTFDPPHSGPDSNLVNNAEQKLGKKRTAVTARRSGADATVVLKYLAAHFFACLACKEAG